MAEDAETQLFSVPLSTHMSVVYQRQYASYSLAIQNENSNDEIFVSSMKILQNKAHLPVF
jgi:hypothetical protein